MVKTPNNKNCCLRNWCLGFIWDLEIEIGEYAGESHPSLSQVGSKAGAVALEDGE